MPFQFFRLMFFFKNSNEFLRACLLLGVCLDNPNVASNIWFYKGIPGFWKGQSNDGLELIIGDVEIGIVHHTELFPMFLELPKVCNDVIAISCTFPEQGPLYGDSDLVVFSFVNSFKTFPDFV